MNYITIDFETANSNPTSACSIGIVVVEDNVIIDKLYYLINPEEEFLDYNTTIHHISFYDVQDADTFGELWPKIKHLFLDSVVYAHNANFDISVLKAMIEKYSLEAPKIKWGCTLKIARKLWKDELLNCKLGTISSYLDIEHDYHNALSDAYVCVAIINRGLKVMQVDNDRELYEILGIRYGEYNSQRFYGSFNKYGRSKKDEIIQNELLNDKVIYLSGKPKKLTKNELKNKLLDNGVYIEKNINLSLDYFVVLANTTKSSLERLAALEGKGHAIKIIDEDTIIGMLNDKI